MAARKQTKKDELTPKQTRFVKEYLVDLNATRAAARAGYAHPGPQGARLLSNVRIAAAVTVHQDRRAERTQIDADWVLKRLAQESEADLGDLYKDDGSLKHVKEWPLIWRQGLVAGVESLTVGESGAVLHKIKLSDRIRRLELLGKHVNVQAFRDQVKHEGGISLTISQEDAEL